MAFKDNLDALPAMQGERLVLLDEAGTQVGVIVNGPGTSGSFRIYAYLASKHGVIDIAAAQEGQSIYAEHADDARLYPGKHPNIDRLFEVLATGKIYKVWVE